MGKPTNSTNNIKNTTVNKQLVAGEINITIRKAETAEDAQKCFEVFAEADRSLLPTLFSMGDGSLIEYLRSFHGDVKLKLILKILFFFAFAVTFFYLNFVAKFKQAQILYLTLLGTPLVWIMVICGFLIMLHFFCKISLEVFIMDAKNTDFKNLSQFYKNGAFLLAEAEELVEIPKSVMLQSKNKSSSSENQKMLTTKKTVVGCCGCDFVRPESQDFKLALSEVFKKHKDLNITTSVEIRRMAVSPKYRRMHIGTLLLQTLEENFIKQQEIDVFSQKGEENSELGELKKENKGIESVVLLTSTLQRPAIALYKKLGYHVVCSNYFPIPVLNYFPIKNVSCLKRIKTK